MRNFIVTVGLVVLAVAASAQVPSVELNKDAAKEVGKLMRRANQNGDRLIKFQGGPQVTTYSVGNLACYFQNSDGSVSCTVVANHGQ